MLPNVVFEVAAGGALAAVAVPLVAGQLGAGRREDADRTASALLTWALVVLVPLAAAARAGRAVAQRPAPRRRPGAGQRPTLGTRMLLIFAPQVRSTASGIVLAGVLQAHRRFLAAALAPLLSSLVVIAAYLGYGWWPTPDTRPRTSPTPPSGCSPGAPRWAWSCSACRCSSRPAHRVAAAADADASPPASPAGPARWRRGRPRPGRPAGCGAVTLWLTHSPRTVASASSTSTTTSRRSTCCRMPCWPSRWRPRPSRRWRTGPAPDRGGGAHGARARWLAGCGHRAAHRRRCRGAHRRGPARRATSSASFDRGADAGGGAALAALPGALSAYAPGSSASASRPCSPARSTSAVGRCTRRWPSPRVGARRAACPRRWCPRVRRRAPRWASSASAHPRDDPGGGRAPLLVRRAWGPRRCGARGRTLGAAVVAVAVGLAVGDTVAAVPVADRLWDALGGGVVVAVGDAAGLPRRDGGRRPPGREGAAGPRPRRRRGDSCVRVVMLVGRSTGGIGAARRRPRHAVCAAWATTSPWSPTRATADRFGLARRPPVVARAGCRRCAGRCAACDLRRALVAGRTSSTRTVTRRAWSPPRRGSGTRHATGRHPAQRACSARWPRGSALAWSSASWRGAPTWSPGASSDLVDGRGGSAPAPPGSRRPSPRARSCSRPAARPSQRSAAGRGAVAGERDRAAAERPLVLTIAGSPPRRTSTPSSTPLAACPAMAVDAVWSSSVTATRDLLRGSRAGGHDGPPVRFVGQQDDADRWLRGRRRLRAVSRWEGGPWSSRRRWRPGCPSSRPTRAACVTWSAASAPSSRCGDARAARRGRRRDYLADPAARHTASVAGRERATSWADGEATASRWREWYSACSG